MIYLVIGLIVVNGILFYLFSSKIGVLKRLYLELASKEYIGVIDYNTVREKITAWSEMRYKMLNEKIDNVASANSSSNESIFKDIAAIMFKLNAIQKELENDNKSETFVSGDVIESSKVRRR